MALPVLVEIIRSGLEYELPDHQVEHVGELTNGSHRLLIKKRDHRPVGEANSRVYLDINSDTICVIEPFCENVFRGVHTQWAAYDINDPNSIQVVIDTILRHV